VSCAYAKGPVDRRPTGDFARGAALLRFFGHQGIQRPDIGCERPYRTRDQALRVRTQSPASGISGLIAFADADL